ncbi:transmembrane protein [Legionella beliardensis]|uniref:Transmembrane protein n=1 Tax=Legionella beliardensis TaxID=91822 RepID=A0A378HZ38_9GAMM|nr:EamA family transporter [Legionella beliardensis]STX28177.1 transmembrane protein [Legionella beliardensis]
MVVGKKVNYALSLTLLFWASAFVGIRFGLASYTPGALALLRFLIASFCMAIIYLRLPNKIKMPWLTRIQLLVIGVGAIGIYNLCLNIGELTVSAGVASFIIGVNPVITLLLSIFLFKERTNFIVWLGVILSLVGLLLIASSEHLSAYQPGLFVILISTLMSSMYNLTQKYYLRTYHPIVVTSWIMWGGNLFLLFFLPDLSQEFFAASLQATLAVIYMGIFPAAVAYVLWCYVLTHMPASRASLYIYFLPLISTALGFLLLGETTSFMALLGGVLALIGAVIAKQAHLGLVKTSMNAQASSLIK